MALRCSVSQRRDPDFERTQESALEFARLRALRLAKDIGVSGDAVNERFGILINAIGLEWLTDAAEDVPQGRALPFRRHPIGDLISTAGPLQIAELLELGLYLGNIANVPGSSDVIAALKGQYRQTFFQLAFAYMAKSAGATIRRLEPETSGGRLADLAMEIEGQAVHAECFRPTVAVPDNNELVFIARQALEVARGASIVVAVAIALKVDATPDVRREIVNGVRELVADVENRSGPSEPDFPTIAAESEEAIVSVCQALPVPAGTPPRFLVAPGFPPRGDTPDLFIRSSSGLASDLLGIEGGVDRGVGGSHVAVWLPNDPDELPADRPLGEILEKLGRKIERKVAQTAAASGGSRLIAVDTWVTSRLAGPESDLAIDRLRGKVLDAHDGMIGLLMMRREPKPNGTGYVYLFGPISPRDRVGLPQSFLDRFLNLSQVVLVNR
jgi:hypothetical protein